MNFIVFLKEIKKPRNSWLRFDLEKLKDPAIAEEFIAENWIDEQCEDVDASFSTMKKFNIVQKLTHTIEQPVLSQGAIGEWFHTSVGVLQGCLLSLTLFNIFLERMSDT